MNNPNILYFAFALYEEDYNRCYMRIKRRNLRDMHNPFEIPNMEFINTFRLTKPLVHELIETLRNHGGQARRRTKVPFYLRVLVALNFFGGGSYQRKTAGHILTCMGQSTVSRSISEVARLIARYIMPNEIRFPTTNEEKNIIKEGFYQKWTIRGVIGAIDGTHIEIIAPCVTDVDHPPFIYINRKGRHSINVMLICDSNNFILAVEARYPGSTHDAVAWQMSDVKRFIRQNYHNGDKSSHLIGDSGYALEPWLFTPVNNFLDNSSEHRYNSVHIRARNVIEQANGILKSRFRCLSRHRVLHYHPASAAYIIYACCVLHNMMRKTGLDINDDEVDDEIEHDLDPEINENGNENEGEPNNYLLLGRRTRTEYIEQNYS